MKYEKFMKITDEWSDSDVVLFLMEYPDWNASILEHIVKEWVDILPIGIEEIAFYAKDNSILEYTNLPEEDE